MSQITELKIRVAMTLTEKPKQTNEIIECIVRGCSKHSIDRILHMLEIYGIVISISCGNGAYDIEYDLSESSKKKLKDALTKKIKV